MRFMFRQLATIATLSITLFCLSCSSPEIDLGKFDKKKWKSDRYGCAGLRSKMSAEVTYVTNQLAEQREVVVRENLGLPDREELDARMKKTLYYFMEPGPKCDSSLSKPIKTLAIELDPVGREVKLVTFQLIR